jgi:hypothetical protein
MFDDPPPAALPAAGPPPAAARRLVVPDYKYWYSLLISLYHGIHIFSNFIQCAMMNNQNSVRQRIEKRVKIEFFFHFFKFGNKSDSKNGYSTQNQNYSQFIDELNQTMRNTFFVSCLVAMICYIFIHSF